jgi:hypothetical protein
LLAEDAEAMRLSIALLLPLPFRVPARSSAGDGYAELSPLPGSPHRWPRGFLEAVETGHAASGPFDLRPSFHVLGDLPVLERIVHHRLHHQLLGDGLFDHRGEHGRRDVRIERADRSGSEACRRAAEVCVALIGPKPGDRLVDRREALDHRLEASSGLLHPRKTTGVAFRLTFHSIRLTFHSSRVTFHSLRLACH